MEVDNREAKKHKTEKRKNTNTVHSNTARSIPLYFYLQQYKLPSFENIHFAAYLRFHPHRTALHDLSWVLYYLTIMYQLHTLLSVDEAYCADQVCSPRSLLFIGYRGGGEEEGICRGVRLTTHQG